jgi:hypothetical protein
MPFLYSIPRTPVRRPPPHHAQKPSSDPAVRLPSPVVRNNRPPLTADCPKTALEILYSAHNRIFPNGHICEPLTRSPKDPSGKIVHNASEPSPPNRWGAILTNGNSRSDTRPNDGTKPVPGSQCPAVDPKTVHPTSNPKHQPSHTRPETHQNLIHSCKEQHGHPQTMIMGGRSPGSNPRAGNRRNHTPGTLCPDARSHRTRTSAILRPSVNFPAPAFTQKTPQPPAGMETIGIEPTTPCLQSRCSPS